MFLAEKNNIIVVIRRLLRCYKVKVTEGTIIEYFKAYPGNLSLKSVCDFFDSINVSNSALNIDKTDLPGFDEPFIAYIAENRGRLFLIHSINRENVIYSDSPVREKSISTDLFLKKWDGAVIVIEPAELSGEIGYSEKRKDEIIKSALFPSVFLIFLTAILYGISMNNSYSADLMTNVKSNGILLFSHLAGLIFSMLLLGRELNFRTRLTDKFCHIGSSMDCDAVIASKASKVFGIIAWADIGVVYFAGGLVILSVFTSGDSYSLLALLSLAAMPYTVFSIFYQWLKLKKWCPLCLSVQLILIVEFIILVTYVNTISLDAPVLIRAFLLFSVVFLFELTIKLLFISEKEKEHNKTELLRIKQDPDLFIYKLKLGEKIDIPFDSSSLIFGNLQSKVAISVFLSLNCSSCEKIFNPAMKIINKNINASVQIILSSSNSEMSSRLMEVLYFLKKSGKDNDVILMLDKWYNDNIKVKQEILAHGSIPVNGMEIKSVINYHNRLFLEGRVKKVPSVYINGFPMPGIYSLEDIAYYIPALEKMQNELTEIIL